MRCCRVCYRNLRHWKTRVFILFPYKDGQSCLWAFALVSCRCHSSVRGVRAVISSTPSAFCFLQPQSGCASQIFSLNIFHAFLLLHVSVSLWFSNTDHRRIVFFRAFILLWFCYVSSQSPLFLQS